MIIRITPDKERAKSILALIKERESFVATINPQQFPTLAMENYYEIIKELATCLLLIDGQRAVGEQAHKDLLEYLANYREFFQHDLVFLNDLRIKKNNSSYDGKKIEPVYLANNKTKILEIIDRLKKMINKML